MRHSLIGLLVSFAMTVPARAHFIWLLPDESGAAKPTARGPRAESAAGRATEPAWGTFFAWARLAHREGTAHERLLIELGDRRFGHGALLKFDERKPPGPPGFAVNRDHDLRRLAHAREVGAQVCLGGPIGHVADEQTYCH